MWLDIELQPLKALLEAAEAGQKTGKLKRSAKNLGVALTELRREIQYQQDGEALYRERIKRRQRAAQ